jgi:hypothetical protein
MKKETIILITILLAPVIGRSQHFLGAGGDYGKALVHNGSFDHLQYYLDPKELNVQSRVNDLCDRAMAAVKADEGNWTVNSVEDFRKKTEDFKTYASNYRRGSQFCVEETFGRCWYMSCNYKMELQLNESSPLFQKLTAFNNEVQAQNAQSAAGLSDQMSKLQPGQMPDEATIKKMQAAMSQQQAPRSAVITITISTNAAPGETVLRNASNHKLNIAGAAVAFSFTKLEDKADAPTAYIVYGTPIKNSDGETDWKIAPSKRWADKNYVQLCIEGGTEEIARYIISKIDLNSIRQIVGQ